MSSSGGWKTVSRKQPVTGGGGNSSKKKKKNPTTSMNLLENHHQSGSIGGSDERESNRTVESPASVAKSYSKRVKEVLKELSTNKNISAFAEVCVCSISSSVAGIMADGLLDDNNDYKSNSRLQVVQVDFIALGVGEMSTSAALLQFALFLYLVDVAKRSLPSISPFVKGGNVEFCDPLLKKDAAEHIVCEGFGVNSSISNRKGVHTAGIAAHAPPHHVLHPHHETSAKRTAEKKSACCSTTSSSSSSASPPHLAVCPTQSVSPSSKANSPGNHALDDGGAVTKRGISRGGLQLEMPLSGGGGGLRSLPVAIMDKAATTSSPPTPPQVSASSSTTPPTNNVVLVAFMPHCCKSLYHNILAANWTGLDRLVIIGNDLSKYVGRAVMMPALPSSSGGGGSKKQKKNDSENLVEELSAQMDIRRLADVGLKETGSSPKGQTGGDAGVPDDSVQRKEPEEEEEEDVGFSGRGTRSGTKFSSIGRIRAVEVEAALSDLSCCWVPREIAKSFVTTETSSASSPAGKKNKLNKKPIMGSNGGAEGSRKEAFMIGGDGDAFICSSERRIKRRPKYILSAPDLL